MLLSHNKKFLFIAVHKTGSTSVRRLLSKYCEKKATSDKKSAYFYHAKASVVKDEFMMCQYDWNSYFKFAIVRNPWDRVVSAYFYRKKMTNKWKSNPPKDKFYKDVNDSFSYELANSENFKDWVQKFLINGDKEIVTHQYKYVTDENNKIILDFIGKIENIKSDIEFIFKKINLHDLTLPQMNQLNRGNYIQYYDQYTTDLISDYYSTDINLFNYSFDDGK